jgi:hypothetical protein
MATALALAIHITAKDAPVIVSEGIVLTKSESLAKQIQKRIEEIRKEDPEKNPTVHLGTISLLEEIAFDKWDIEINNALVERMSKRGRKSLPKVWKVYCQECKWDWFEKSTQPTTCDSCGGVYLKVEEEA